MDKIKRTPITETQLELLSEEGKHEKLNYYLSLLKEDSHNSLSFEEKLWVYKNIINNYLYCQLYRDTFSNMWDDYLPYLENKYLEDAKFYYLFFYCDYCQDLEGYKEHKYFSIFVSSFAFIESSNIENVRFLDAVYLDWNKIITIKTGENKLLVQAIEEYKLMNKQERKVYKKQELGSNFWLLREKPFALFYKYVYLKGQIIFKDKSEFILPLLEKNIVFDIESYFHIHRHFAQSLKPDLLNKSYIRKDFLPDNIVQILSDIFLKISESDSEIILLDEDFGICFELNQVVYQLWIIKNKSENTFRISSLYPVERTSVGNDFRELHRIKLADNLYYFSKDKIILQ